MHIEPGDDEEKNAGPFAIEIHNRTSQILLGKVAENHRWSPDLFLGPPRNAKTIRQFRLHIDPNIEKCASGNEKTKDFLWMLFKREVRTSEIHTLRPSKKLQMIGSGIAKSTPELKLGIQTKNVYRILATYQHIDAGALQAECWDCITLRQW